MASESKAAVAALLLWLAAGGWTAHAGESSNSLPFAPGETLVYKVNWDPPAWLFFLPNMYAGDITMRVVGPQGESQGGAFRFIAEAKSSGFLTSLARIKIDDYFESVVDAESLCMLKMIKRINEGKRRRAVHMVFHKAERRLHVREIDLAVDPPAEKKNENLNKVPPCFNDILSALYAARTRALEPGRSWKMMLCDEGKLKEIEVRALKEEKVRTPLDIFDTVKVQAISVFGGLFKSGGQLNVWVSRDSKRIPVRFDAKVKFGRVFGHLVSIVPGGETRRPE